MEWRFSIRAKSHFSSCSTLEKDLKKEESLEKIWTWCSGNVESSFHNSSRKGCQSQNILHSNSRRTLTDVVLIENCVPLQNGLLFVYNAVLIDVPELFRTKIRHNVRLRTQIVGKTVTLFSGDPTVHQIVICAPKVHFR